MLNLHPTVEERRRRRTDRPELALGYQLDQVVQDFGLECCLIVDESGQIIAVSPESSTAFIQSLAALTPAMATLPQAQELHLEQLRRHNPELKGNQISTCVFRAANRRLYIAAVGQEALMNEVAIFRAITGARRIVQ